MNTLSIFTSLALLQCVVSATSDATPQCLQSCMTQVLNPCDNNSLPDLIACLDSGCTSSESDELTFSFCPKDEASCATSSSQPDVGMSLTSNGECANSSFDFASFMPDSTNNTAVAQACKLMLYSDADCQGQANEMSLDPTSNGCVGQGGRSAKLSCASTIDVASVMQQVTTACSRSLGAAVPAPAGSSGGLCGNGSVASTPNATMTVPTSPRLSATASLTPSHGAGNIAHRVDFTLTAVLVAVAVLLT